VGSQVDVLRGNRSAQTRSRAAWCGASCLMVIILLGPAIWNRFPLLQYDTGGYLARWYEGYLVPSRPGAYGLVLAATVRFEFWPILILQAAATIWILALLLREVGLGRRPHVLLAIVAGLSIATTLPWLTSILLTDIFAGLAVLALHLVIFGQTPGPWERRALILFIAFAAATHSATLAVVAVLTMLLVAAALLRGKLTSPAQLRHAGVTLILGVALTLTANWVVSGRFAFTPGGYGILFGRMLQDGIVSRYLRDHCPDRSLKLCPYRGDLPLNADAFLWGESVFNRLGRFAGLGEEMRTIVLDSLREYPLLQVETAVAATARQLVSVATGEGVINHIWHTYGIINRYTPAVAPAMRAARQQRGEIAFEAINHVHVPIALMAAALLPLLIVAGAKWWRRRDLSLLAATVTIALVVNAVVCGALSNPHDRYGARLIWLAPLTLALAPISLLATAVEIGRRRRAYLGGLTAGAKTQDVSAA
jgi:hypothetical protein